MRKTLTVDDDLIGLLKERAAQRGVAFKVVVNDVLRAGLGVETRQVAAVPKVIPHSFGFNPGIDTDKLVQLADELEAEALLSSMKRQLEK